jgi:hypothetical protein
VQRRQQAEAERHKVPPPQPPQPHQSDPRNGLGQ